MISLEIGIFAPPPRPDENIPTLEPDELSCQPYQTQKESYTPLVRQSQALRKRSSAGRQSSSSLPLAQSIAQSIVIRLGTGAWLRFGISVTFDFSPSLSSFLPVMCGLRPLPKFTVHIIALIMVAMIRSIVITANVVSDFRTGRKVGAVARWYMRTSLKIKYAKATK